MDRITINSAAKLAHDVRTQWLALQDFVERANSGQPTQVAELEYVAEELERLSGDAHGIAKDE